MMHFVVKILVVAKRLSELAILQQSDWSMQKVVLES